MIFPPQRRAVAAVTLLFCAILAVPLAVFAQFAPATGGSTISASGQFVISEGGAPGFLPLRPRVPPDSPLLRLEAPWLAVSAERFKAVLWREIGLSASAAWRGKIFIVIQPARSTNDPVVIAPQPFIRVWNYRVDLPDLINSNRYARALSAVILLELANRDTPLTARPADLPAWLVDGLAQRVAGADESGTILSAPTKSGAGIAMVQSGPLPVRGGVPQSRLDENVRGLDPLAAVRRVLQESSVLTFDQLNWPGDVQMSGGDGGVYLASAQLFVDALLKLPRGAVKIRALLAALPRCENWQSAFYDAFREDFRSPLEVEKWWALQAVDFAARSPGPQWTPSVSRDKLAAALTIPVAIRHATNELPERSDISLQEAIRVFDPSRQLEILQARLWDLELVQLRLAPQLAEVAGGYRAELANYLGIKKGRKTAVAKVPKHSPSATRKTLQRLDALDARRRAIEAEIDRKALPVPGG